MDMVDELTIEKAAGLLLAAAPGARVILFGSYSRGDADDRSDVDFLVVEPETTDRFREMVRLRQVLRGLPMAVDILVVSQERFDYWKETPNTLVHTAIREGRVYEQVG